MKYRIAPVMLAGGIMLGGIAVAENRISVDTPQGRTVTVEAVTPTIFRVSNTAQGTAPAPSRIALPQSGTVAGEIESPGRPGFTSLRLPSGAVARIDANGGVRIAGPGGTNPVVDSGTRGTDARGRRVLRLTGPGAGAHVYGAGERGFTYNLAGDTLEVYNTQNYGYTEGDPRIRRMNITMPLLVSPDGYAVLFDDIAAADMVFGDTIAYHSEAPQDLSYYVIYSPEGFTGVTGQVTSLVGRQELPPFWALGYITSKYGYRTERQAREVVDSLKTAGYPVDGMVLDLYWYGKEQDMGRLAWEPEQWPDPVKMLADLKEKGVNMVAISQPFVLKNGKALDNFNFMNDRRMFGRDSLGNTHEVTIWVGEGGMFDMSNPDTRAWLRQRYKELTDSGMTGWWGDLGEPEAHPATMRHANGLTARQYHNYYGNDWSSIVYNLFAEEYPETRLMALMRGGTTGLQRYSVFPWSTDVSRSWGGLQPQIKIMLNAGLSGLGYMSHDVGGFAIDKEHPYDPELYVRWLQLGVFSPVLRTHSQEFAEPYIYTDQQDIVLPLVRERYRWLPYNYTLAYENATKGMPLVRPVGFYEENPAATDTIVDEYLWGRDVLVAPVLTPATDRREVYFPETGVSWVDINDPSHVYAGGTSAMVDAPLSVLPLFARAGALIATADYRMENVGDYTPSRYTINYYPGKRDGESQCVVFEDDRQSRSSLAKGNYALLTVEADNQPKYTTLTVTAEGSYPGKPEARDLTFKVNGMAKAPRSVTANGTQVNVIFDRGTLTIPVTGTALPLSIIIDK